MVENSYNDCGYRSRESCGPKPTGTARIAVLGSSAAMGWLVPYEETFAVRSAKDLARIWNRPVEVQNLGREFCGTSCMFLREDEALALKPDLLIMVVDPYDVEHSSPSDFADRYKSLKSRGGDRTPVKLGMLKSWLKIVSRSESAIVVEHYLYQFPSVYTRQYLARGDTGNFLRTPFTDLWEQRFDVFDQLVGEMAQKAAAAHVPFAMIEIPSVAQAAALADPNPPPHVDPYAFNRRLAQIASGHGLRFINVLDEFKRTPGSNTFFYVADGHVSAPGQALISRGLTSQLAGFKP